MERCRHHIFSGRYFSSSVFEAGTRGPVEVVRRRTAIGHSLSRCSHQHDQFLLISAAKQQNLSVQTYVELISQDNPMRFLRCQLQMRHEDSNDMLDKMTDLVYEHPRT